MDRRALLGSLALATLVLPRAAPAQPARKVARIGILRLEMTADMVGPQARGPQVNMFLRGLRELGYVYGEHFVTEPRGAEGKPERVPSLAAELVRLQVDVIVAAGPALPALKQATSTIPIVMGGASDPVGEGLVQESRTARWELHGVESSVSRDDRKATRVAQGAHSGRGARGGPLDSTAHRGLAGGRNCRPAEAVEAAVARGSRRRRDRRSCQSGDWRGGRCAPCTRGWGLLAARSANRGAGRRGPAPRHVCASAVC